LLVGNTDNDLRNPEWKASWTRISGGRHGEIWSTETRAGWSAADGALRGGDAQHARPRIVAFNVHGNPADYRFFRYAYASCLLDDGYFSIHRQGRHVQQRSVVRRNTTSSWGGRCRGRRPPSGVKESGAGIFRMEWCSSIPPWSGRTVTVEPGLRRLAGTQDPAVNDGAVAGRVSLWPKDGIVLRR